MTMSGALKGKVKWFNDEKGYGFIEPDDGGTDVFVHVNQLRKSKISGLKEGQQVAYDEERDPKKGKTQATNISIL